MRSVRFWAPCRYRFNELIVIQNTMGVEGPGEDLGMYLLLVNINGRS
jgi:hypothetical protein